MPEEKKNRPDRRKDKNNPKEILVDEELKEKEPEIRHLKTKPVPAIVVLLAASIASVYTYVQGRSLGDSLLIIFITIVVFLIVGDLIKFLLDRIEIVIPPEPDEEEETEGEEESGEEEPEEI